MMSHSHCQGKGSKMPASPNMLAGFANAANDEDDIHMEQAIPTDKAVFLLQMIAELKKNGQVPPEANDRRLMHAMHYNLLKQKTEENVQNLGALPGFLPSPSDMASVPTSLAHPVGSGRLVKPPYLSAPFSGHSAMTAQTPEKSLIQEVGDMLRTNPASINHQDKDGDTLLHRVCAANMEGLVEVLLKNGANPNIANHKGQTPVHFSAREGQLLTIQILKDFGADVAALDVDGLSSLHYAASSKAELAPQTLHYLTECCGLSYAARTGSGQSLLHIIAQTEKENNRQMLPLLLSQPELDVGWVDNSGSNALHYSVETCQTHMSYLLVCSQGAKLSLSVNSDGKTPLAIAKTLHKMEGFALSQEMEVWLAKGQGYKPSSSYPFKFYQRLLLPMLILGAGLISARIFTPQYQGFLSLLGLIIFYNCSFAAAARINHVSRLPDPSKLAAFMTGVALSIIVLCSEYSFLDFGDLLTNSRMLLIFGICLCLVVGVVLYARLVFGDPGFTLESKRKENGTFYTMKDLVQLRKPGVWCTICQLIPTKPSKHCKLCNRCVYWMDHHCLYTMRCIGKRNYYTFVWFNFVLVAGLGQTLLLFPGYAEHLGYKHAWMELPSPLFYWCCLKYIFMNHGLLFVVLMGMSLSFCNTLYLFYLTLSNISHGYTSYFRPPEGRRPYQSGLAYTDRLSNLTTFIRYGQIKIQDPNFVI